MTDGKTPPETPGHEYLPLRAAIYQGAGRIDLLARDGRRLCLDAAGTRSVLMELSARAPRLLDELPGAKPRDAAQPPACPHSAGYEEDGSCKLCGQNRFRGCGSLRGMRAELTSRGVDVPPLAGVSYLARLLDCSGRKPLITPPSGWRLQCPDCRELDGFHDPDCVLKPPPVPVREEDLDRRVPGTGAEAARLEAIRRRDPALRDPGMQILPGSIAGHRAPAHPHAAPGPGWAGCPDGETCHHGCPYGTCWRVHHAVPLGLAGYPDNRWPDEVTRAYEDGGA